MRLGELEVAGFRGFNKLRTIPLQGDVVIVAGVNGAGKTSLLDSIQWLVSGDVPRLRAHSVRPTKDDYLSSRYASTPPFVRAVFVDGDHHFIAARRGMGSEMETTVELPNGEQLRGQGAEAWLNSLVAEAASTDGRSLRTFILQQDDVKEFLCATDPKERYNFLATFSGVGEAQALDRQLQGEVRQLREAVRDRRAELANEEQRLAALERDLSESQTIAASLRRPQRRELARALTRLAEHAGIDVTTPVALEIVSQIELILDQIEAVVEEAAANLRRAQSILRSDDAHTAIDIEALTEAATRAEDDAEKALELSNELELRVRKLMEERDRLRQFAVLALEQLGDTCPVCQRPYDKDHALEHLNSLVGDDTELVALRQDAADAKARASDARSAALSARQALEAARGAVAARTAVLEEARKLEDVAKSRLAEAQTRIGSDAGEPEMEVDVDAHQNVEDMRRTLDQIRADLRNAEVSARALNQHEAAASRIKSLESEAEAQRQTVVRLRERVSADDGALERAQSVARWFGEQVVDATADAMQLSGPLLNDLYNRLEVHPSFRRFSFRYDRRYEAGQFVRGCMTTTDAWTATRRRFLVRRSSTP
jgi:DNA repair exonuclease SbcCD ATPase subunit